MKRYVMAQKNWVASDQPAHLHSLVSLFCLQYTNLVVSFHWNLKTALFIQTDMFAHDLMPLFMQCCYTVLFPEMSHVVCDQTKSSLICNIKMGLFIITMVWGYVQFIRITTGPLCFFFFFFVVCFVFFFTYVWGKHSFSVVDVNISTFYCIFSVIRWGLPLPKQSQRFKSVCEGKWI